MDSEDPDTIDDGDTDLRTRCEREWCNRVEDSTVTQEFRQITPENELHYLPDETQDKPGQAQFGDAPSRKLLTSRSHSCFCIPTAVQKQYLLDTP